MIFLPTLKSSLFQWTPEFIQVFTKNTSERVENESKNLDFFETQKTLESLIILGFDDEKMWQDNFYIDQCDFLSKYVSD